MTNPLGRIVNHNPKNRNHEFGRGQRPRRVRPISVRHAMNAPHVDQFYTSGCVGFAGTNFLNCAAAQRSRRQFHWIDHVRRSTRYLTNEDGLTNYHNATVNDPFDWTWPPTDEGSSAVGLMKWWRAAGIVTGYEWCFTFDQFLAALQRQPVLVGTEWFEGMTNARLFAHPTGKSQGGHEYLATQINWKTRVIGFENSWGENWGMHGGRFFMRFEDFEPLLANGGDACVPRVL